MRNRRFAVGCTAAFAVCLAICAPAGAQSIPVDAGYHTHAEVESELGRLARTYPQIARKESLAPSFLGRSISALAISDRGGDDAEPGVLIFAGQHGTEHLGTEMALYIAKELTSRYASDPRIAALVNARRVYVVPMVNPDGAEYDIEGGTYRFWRGNMQPQASSLPNPGIGTDLNRNWGFQWSCCAGPSYPGTGPFSAPETVSLRTFVESHHSQRAPIKVAVDVHAYTEAVIWPFGYTKAATVAGQMTAQDQDALATLGRSMAASNGYRALPLREFYVDATPGTVIDWLWATRKVFAYGMEMYPTSYDLGGFYPPSSVIGRETARNREAFLQLIAQADCPYRVVGLQAQKCGLAAPRAVFGDNLESATGWARNLAGRDTATSGRWERAAPKPTDFENSRMQLGTAVSPTRVLVTGAGAGANANANDVDGGLATVTSRTIKLPPKTTPQLTLSYSFAYANSSPDDSMTVRVGSTSPSTVLKLVGVAKKTVAGTWKRVAFNLAPLAGQTVRIEIAVADRGNDSLVEAAVDDIKLTY